ncbi:hypothetical protein ANCDUO_00590 [Ancylostoma duodenale]|uniref:Uncharacterized protein n=1 Tax=Ancylostoma duodenale TaxID=51022 RepID=A0A0C2DGF8_9BILA|nr:hypothetical protein ANCDUO_00590 [Ancylostoma duodenale]
MSIIAVRRGSSQLTGNEPDRRCMLAGRHHGYQALGQKPHFLQRIALGLRVISQDDSLKADTSSQDNVLRAGSPDLLVLDFDEQKQIMDWYSMSSEASASAEAGRSDISSDVPASSTSDFFETLDWSQAQHANAAQPPPPPPPPHGPKPPPRDHHHAVDRPTDPFAVLNTESTQSTQVSSPSSRSFSSRPPVRSGMDAAEAYERQAGIRVTHIADPDSEHYRFDCEKETPILSAFTPPCGQASEFDLLDLGSTAGSVCLFLQGFLCIYDFS